MIIRIKQFKPIENYCLDVTFDGGKRVIYDMKDDIETLPGYSELKKVWGLFPQARLDESRTCIYWNDEIDLPSDEIFEYGREVDC